MFLPIAPNHLINFNTIQSVKYTPSSTKEEVTTMRGPVETFEKVVPSRLVLTFVDGKETVTKTFRGEQADDLNALLERNRAQ